MEKTCHGFMPLLHLRCPSSDSKSCYTHTLSHLNWEVTRIEWFRLSSFRLWMYWMDFFFQEIYLKKKIKHTKEYLNHSSHQSMLAECGARFPKDGVLVFSPAPIVLISQAQGMPAPACICSLLVCYYSPLL